MSDKESQGTEIPQNAYAYFQALGYDEGALSHKINHAKMMMEHVAGFGEVPIEMGTAMENIGMDRSSVARWLNRLDDNIEIISVDDDDEEQIMLLYGDIYKLLFTEIIQTLGRGEDYMSPKKLVGEYVSRLDAGPESVPIVANLIEISEMGDKRKGLYAIRVKNDRPELPPLFPPVYVYDRKGKTVACMNLMDVEDEDGMLAEFFASDRITGTAIGFVGFVAVITGIVLWWRNAKKKKGDE